MARGVKLPVTISGLDCLPQSAVRPFGHKVAGNMEAQYV